MIWAWTWPLYCIAALIGLVVLIYGLKRARDLQAEVGSSHMSRSMGGCRCCACLCCVIDCLNDCSKACDALWWFVMALMVPVGAMLACLAVFFLAFPVLCKLQVAHVQDSALLCVPLPSGEVVGLNGYVWPVYCVLAAKGFKELLLDEFKDPGAKSMGVTIFKMWLGTQMFDVFTDTAGLLSLAGHVRAWCLLLWLLTCVVSAGVTITAGAIHAAYGRIDEVRFFRLMLVQLVFEDTVQLVLASLGMFDSTLAAGMNQYLLYGLVTNLLGVLTLAKKLATRRSLLCATPQDASADAGEVESGSCPGGRPGEGDSLVKGEDARGPSQTEVDRAEDSTHDGSIEGADRKRQDAASDLEDLLLGAPSQRRMSSP